MPKASQTTIIDVCFVKTGIQDGHLNMRAEPSEISQIITVLNEGQKLYPIGIIQNGWLPVAVENCENVGYVNASYTTCPEEK